MTSGLLTWINLSCVQLFHVFFVVVLVVSITFSLLNIKSGLEKATAKIFKYLILLNV